MSWWNGWSTRKRTALVGVVVALVAAGIGSAVALGGDDETRAAPDTSPTPSVSASSSPSADPTAPADGTQKAGSTASSGRIVVTIATNTGERPVEVGVFATEVDTGAELHHGQFLDPPSHTLTLDDVPPGRYVVGAGSDDSVWEAAYYGQTSGTDIDRSQAKIVTVAPGRTERVTITLIYWPCGDRPGEIPDCGDDATDPTQAPTPKPTTTPSATDPTPTP